MTPEAELVNACQAAIFETTGITAELSTSGGTSDGRFIAPTGAQVVELGPTNASIHKIDEYVAVESPEELSRVYTAVLTKLLT